MSVINKRILKPSQLSKFLLSKVCSSHNSHCIINHSIQRGRKSTKGRKENKPKRR